MPSVGAAQEDSLFGELTWRNLGPAVMGGRATEVEGVPGNLRIVYPGAASGGVCKTIDDGVTCKPILDDRPIASIGDMALERKEAVP